MPKRSCPSETNEQPLKKHVTEVNSVRKAREIRSSSAERTLQLLYEGSTKFFNSHEFASKNNGISKNVCYGCSVPLSSTVTVCAFCCRRLCPQCANLCHNCKEEFCSNCSLPTYDQNESACYSCYR